MDNERREEAVTILRKAGFRATEPRLLVLSFLQNAKYPVSIQEIVAGMGNKSIHQVTVYRILHALKHAGIVTQVDFRHGRSYYELRDEQHDHHHIVCVKCGRVEDFVGCDYERLAAKALKQARGFATIVSHSLELFGMCNTCSKRKVRAA